MSERSINIKLESNDSYKIEKICKQFELETNEKLTTDECLKLSLEVLNEEVENIGIGRLFLRKYLWKKDVLFLSGRGGVIGSQ